MALNRKIAYINLTTGNIEIKPIPIKMREFFLGGRGLDAYLMYNHINPGVDPLGPDNVVFISAGVLAGTPASASSRTHVAGKSPLTNSLGSTNISGFFSTELRWAGFDHLVIKGKAIRPVYLWIHNGEIEIRDAQNAWGKMVPEAQQSIRDELGDRDIKVLTIGPAGEKLVRFANIMNGLKHSCGGSGMGALLGSKKLKAIAARGTMDINLAHPAEALDYERKIISQITSANVSQIRGRTGTPFIRRVPHTQELAQKCNYEINQLEDAYNVDEAKDLHKYAIVMAGYFGCQINCHAEYITSDYLYTRAYNQWQAYSTQGASAHELNCRNTLTALMGNHLIDAYGIDILEASSLITWAMEIYENGILTDKDTKGLELRFGSDEAVIEILHNIARREGLGDILAEGGLRAAEKIGKDSIKYLIHVKGMFNPLFDDRTISALALGIAVGSRCSDYLSNCLASDLHYLPEPVLKEIFNQPASSNEPLTSSHWHYAGTPWRVYWHETTCMAMDCLGAYKHYAKCPVTTVPNNEEWAKMLYYNTGLEISPLAIWTVAERAYNMEHLFNIREELARSLDCPVYRYYNEPALLIIPNVQSITIDRDQLKRMIDKYYKHHGWDEKGVPTPDTLQRLGIDNEPSKML